MPGTWKVTVVPLICSDPRSGSIVIIKPAAPIFLTVSATAAIVADSYSKSKV